MSLGRRSLNCLEEQPCAQGEQGLKLFEGVAMFPKEQMCPKFCLTITFAYDL
jgi:hypothetical protein